MPNMTLILLLMGIVLFSGCISAPTTGLGQGIIFESLEADFTNVFVDEPVTIRARVRNTGNSDSGEGGIAIVGIDTKFIKSASDGCVWESLHGADTTFGTPGESSNCAITLFFGDEELNLPIGFTSVYQPIARLFYSYTTTVSKKIPLVSQSELRAIQNRGEALPIDTVSSTGGPVSLDIKTSGPIRYSESDVEFPLVIEVTNNLDGVPYIFDYFDSNNWNKIEISFDALELNDIDIVDDCDPVIPLFRGQSATIVCKAKISVNNVAGLAEKNLVISSAYSYFLDRPLSITVSHREPF